MDLVNASAGRWCNPWLLPGSVLCFEEQHIVHASADSAQQEEKRFAISLFLWDGNVTAHIWWACRRVSGCILYMPGR